MIEPRTRFVTVYPYSTLLSVYGNKCFKARKLLTDARLSKVAEVLLADRKHDLYRNDK